MSFPRDRGELSPQVYSTLLLIAAVRLHGGELRIPVLLLEGVKGGESVLHDYDYSTQELVLRSGSTAANLLALPQEDKWQTKSSPVSPVVISPNLSATQKSRSTADDLRTADLERQQQHETLLRDLRQRRNSTMQEMFSTSLDEALKKGEGRTG